MMEGPPLDFTSNAPPRTDLEEQAYALAERAANCAHDNTRGRSPRWEDYGAHGQAGLMAQVLTWLAIKAVSEDHRLGAH